MSYLSLSRDRFELDRDSELELDELEEDRDELLLSSDEEYLLFLFDLCFLGYQCATCAWNFPNRICISSSCPWDILDIPSSYL